MTILAAGDAGGFSWSSILGGVVGAVVIFAIVECIKRVMLVPKLKPVLRGDKFGRLPTIEDLSVTAECPTAGDGPPVKVLLSSNTRKCQYVRISVTNEGWDTARGCRGFLTNFEKCAGPDKFERLFFDHVPLHWSYLPADAEQVVSIPMDGKTIVNLDVFSTSEGEKDYSMRLVSMPNSYKSIFQQTGEFRLTIHITADNAKTAEIMLYLNWQGDWQNYKVADWPRS